MLFKPALLSHRWNGRSGRCRTPRNEKGQPLRAAPLRLRLKFSIKLRIISAPTLRRSVHQGFTKELYEALMSDLKQKFDSSTVAVMRQALNEVITDRRFLVRKSVTPLEVAEHILQQAASGVRDLNRLKSSVFEKLSAAAWGARRAGLA
jgi:hypothetical protein